MGSFLQHCSKVQAMLSNYGAYAVYAVQQHKLACTSESCKPNALHDELGTCRTSLVSPEQPVLCIPVIRPTNTTVCTGLLPSKRKMLQAYFFGYNSLHWSAFMQMEHAAGILLWLHDPQTAAGGTGPPP